MTTIFTTMVYNDPIFLDFWVRYYEKHTARKNLHIITHGPDEDYAYEIAKGCKFIECPRDPKNPNLDQDRFKFINQYCAELTTKADRVIYNDVDEIVVLDPDHPSSLIKYIESIDKRNQVITPIGLEIVHQKYLENDFDYNRPLFKQRNFVRVNAWYCKPCITNTPITWGPDGHGSSHGKLHIDNNLYLFHLKYFDDKFHRDRHEARLKMRFNDAEGKEVIIGAGSWGWSALDYKVNVNSFMRHTHDRYDDGFNFDRSTKRMYESFKGNQHGMYKMDWFVEGDFREIPERFDNVI